MNLMKARFLAGLAILAICSTSAEEIDQERVTVGGYVKAPGPRALDRNVSVISFLVQNEYIKVDSEMKQEYERHSRLKHYRIRVFRGGEMIELEFKGKDSFASTIQIQAGDVIDVTLTEHLSRARWAVLKATLR